LASPSSPASPPPRTDRTRQALDRRERRRRPRAHRVHLGEHDPSTPTSRTGEHRRLTSTTNQLGWGGRRRPTGGTSTSYYAIPTRDPSSRQLTTGHCPAVPTRVSQSDSRRCRRAGRPGPSSPHHHHDQDNNNPHSQRPLDIRVHLSGPVSKSDAEPPDPTHRL